jgi:hypothetical protein
MAFIHAAPGSVQSALRIGKHTTGSSTLCLWRVLAEPGGCGRRCARCGRGRTTRRPRPTGSSIQPTAPAASPAPRRRRARARRCSRRASSRAHGLAAAPSASLDLAACRHMALDATGVDWRGVRCPHTHTHALCCYSRFGMNRSTLTHRTHFTSSSVALSAVQVPVDKQHGGAASAAAATISLAPRHHWLSSSRRLHAGTASCTSRPTAAAATPSTRSTAARSTWLRGAGMTAPPPRPPPASRRAAPPTARACASCSARRPRRGALLVAPLLTAVQVML